MLTVAPSAAEAITTLVTSNGLPEDAGIRLSPAGSENANGAGLQIEVTDGPGPADQVIEQDGAHVFVDPEVADALEDRTLEASAQDNRVAFAIG